MLRSIAIAGVIFASFLWSQERAAVIVNSGSTNRAGFRITVERSGAAEMIAMPRRSGRQTDQAAPIRRTLPRELVDIFYAELGAGKPLGSMPAAHCAKSVSFGSSLVVVWGEDQTPDLSCGDGGNQAMRDLIRDTNRIVAAMRE